MPGQGLAHSVQPYLLITYTRLFEDAFVDPSVVAHDTEDIPPSCVWVVRTVLGDALRAFRSSFPTPQPGRACFLLYVFRVCVLFSVAHLMTLEVWESCSWAKLPVTRIWSLNGMGQKRLSLRGVSLNPCFPPVSYSSLFCSN